MDYEKAYLEALDRAKAGKPIDEVFPELKESEDERIRKHIIGILNSLPIYYWHDQKKKNDALAYLEKQKEKKPSSYSNLEITNVVRKALQECEGFNNYRPDVYAARVGATVESLLQEQKPAEWSEKYIADIFEKVGLAKIAREQGNDKLTNALQDAMLELSKDGNAEWSEGDEKYLNLAINIVASDLGEDSPTVNWLKSLRPQPHWKPSEEQIGALEDAKMRISLSGYGLCPILQSLIDDLKKL